MVSWRVFTTRCSYLAIDLRERRVRQRSRERAAHTTPAASRLGEHRAILYRDDLGTQVKFRPYGSPDAEWLQLVRDCFAGRSVGRARKSPTEAARD